MPFLDLPNELIAAIFGWVGRDFFRSDFARLVVSKRWYMFAIREYLREIDITPEKAYRLLHSATRERGTELLQAYAHHIRFSTQAFYTLQAEVDEYEKLEPLEHWVRYLHGHTRDLLVILAGCTSLQNLSFRTSCAVYGLYAPSEQHKGENYWLTTPAEELVISLTTVADLISVAYTHNLAALELDLRGSECVVTRDDVESSSWHLCPLLARLLLRKHMRRLSICVHTACPDILVPPISISDTEQSTVWVEEFVLHVTPVIGKHSQLCYGDNGEEADPYTFEQLAKTMLSSMARPRIVRVVSHDPPNPESIDIAYYLRVYDAIADTAKLAECVPWTGQPLSLRSFKRRLEDLF